MQGYTGTSQASLGGFKALDGAADEWATKSLEPFQDSSLSGIASVGDLTNFLTDGSASEPIDSFGSGNGVSTGRRTLFR